MNKPHQQNRMDAVVSYIESQLDQKIAVAELAELACYSQFHFHRLFRATYGQSVYAMQKRLLLERAVKQLAYSTAPITQIALDAGYDNASSFNKAFLNQFGQTPSQVRAQRSTTKSNLSIPQQKANTMNLTADPLKAPEIKVTKPITLLCARKTGSYQQAAEQAWSTLMPFTYSNKLMHKQTQLFGITHDDPSVTAPDHIRYDAGISSDSDIALAPGIERKTLAGGKYAIFLHKGLHAKLADSYDYIFAQWLPNSGYTLRDAPCFERYLNRDPRRTKPENLKTEIFIPLE